MIDALQTRGTSDKIYQDAQAENKDLSDIRGLSAVFDKYKLDALVIPTMANASLPAAIAGWPMVSPLIVVCGLSINLTADHPIPVHCSIGLLQSQLMSGEGSTTLRSFVYSSSIR